MYSLVVKSIFFGILFKYFLEYRDWLDWQKDLIFNVRPGKCHTVLEEGGSEDVTHIGNGTVIISSGFKFGGGSQGFIKSVNVNNGSVVTMNISHAPDRPDFMFAPHGLSPWRDPQTGTIYLYVISHANTECVEVFEIVDDTQLKYLKTITDSAFTFMNDLVVVGMNKFYITKFAQFQDTTKYNIELFSRWKSGKVLFYDGHKAREVVSGLNHPNGINVSPDGKVVYVAEWAAKTIRAYRRESTNNLNEIWNFNMETGIDNIEVDPDTGDLWIGCHPITWKVLDFMGIFNARHPGQALHLKMVDNAISEVIEVFADDGNFMSGTSSATFVNGKLVIGTVFNKMAICEMAVDE